VFEVLDEPERIVKLPDAVRFSGVRSGIQLNRVSFGYSAARQVLRDVTLTIEAGECVGITGPTGSGKSTLLSLLKRFYDVDAGEILFDGQDIRTLDPDDVRRASGIVFQDSFLFSNSVAANIAFGVPGATLAQVERAARCGVSPPRRIPLKRLAFEPKKHLGGHERQKSVA